MIKYILIFLPLFSYSQDTAKYCFTAKEMDFWIGQTIDAKTYKGATDSLFIVIDSMAQDKADLKELNKDCNKLNQSYKKVLKKKNLAVYLWEGISGAIASAWVYREIKQLIR